MKLTHPDSDQTIEVEDAHADRYLGQGWRKPEDGAPAGNASREDWHAYAVSRGFSEPDLEDLTRDQIRAAVG